MLAEFIICIGVSVAHQVVTLHVGVAIVRALCAGWRGRCTAHLASVAGSVGEAGLLAELLLCPVVIVLAEVAVCVGILVARHVVVHHVFVPLIGALCAGRG